ncbi:MAG: class I mannose-6-phosphate isomerase [Myxococcota bacterium]|nr:class I mannose-6-phosphate isomerase [Myxococcota bacterium]MDW8361912.1 class I mannose-6-phosphate isomerase [Myxococcales bacterium]
MQTLFVPRPDNFTPPARTPWGGRRIAALKRGLVPTPQGPIGESWEVSFAEPFESRLDDGRTLREAVGEAAGRALLVKLLDADAPLSVQIHPPEGHRLLGPTQSGKPEAWYLVHAEPGAGLWLGLRAGVGREDVERALRTDADVSALLAWIPVEPGDFFVIEPGTAHAIGPGLMLVEPQRVEPGREGVTYRYWDWNRRYDEHGRPHPQGRRRELHIAQALEVTDWGAPREAELCARVRVRAGSVDTDAPAVRQALCGPRDAPVRSEALEIDRVAGSGCVHLDERPMLRAITVLAGHVHVALGGERTVLGAGRSAVLLGGRGAPRLELERAHAIVSAAP